MGANNPLAGTSNQPQVSGSMPPPPANLNSTFTGVTSGVGQDFSGTMEKMPFVSNNIGGGTSQGIGVGGEINNMLPDGGVARETNGAPLGSMAQLTKYGNDMKAIQDANGAQISFSDWAANNGGTGINNQSRLAQETGGTFANPNTSTLGTGQTTSPYMNSTNPYIQAAQATTMGNLYGAQAATQANRMNQNTPYSSLNYTQGVDANGNPTWTANQQLAQPLQQSLQNIQGQLAQSTATPFDASQYQANQVGQGPQFSQMGNAANLQTSVNGTGMEGWDAATNLINQRLQPQIQQSQDRLTAQLANQGIVPGTEAYNRAMTLQGQKTNDLMTQAQLAGSQVQNQMFNQNVAAGQFGNQALTQQNQNQLANLGFNNQTGQQGFQNQLAGTQANNAAIQQNYANALQQKNLPLQQLNAFQQGTQPGYINPYSQAAVAGPDYLGAYTTSQAAQIAAQNAANAKTANTQSGLYGLGAAALLGGGGANGLLNLGSKGINSLSDLTQWFNNLGGDLTAGGTITADTGDAAQTAADFYGSTYDPLAGWSI